MTEIDFTPMLAAHDAFRRDLDRLVAAAEAGLGGHPTVRSGWQTFQEQLDIHHKAEDEALWPRMRTRLADRPTDLALLDAMEAEHACVDPLLDAVDSALGTPGPALSEAAEKLSAALREHLEHEERDTLALITEEEWKAFSSHVRKTQGLSGAAEFFPWLMDDATPTGRRGAFLASLPLPARLVFKLRWQPRYSRAHRWAALTMATSA
ncbi:hemerythrin domain-containing protein [Actinomadura barringtoniae]|uniref:Hemerythrin domain-containing protein n=1 Tax=Actinomadura barringtoniae TaxID=1427535 RepID=A0A939P724_9ACTN|nr:hemerythrin domain-containing protein [Actinomadura barringtoniae]MBO2446565.1 hemerythrin domain-containing protein [Actinomadura barringtoniae]